jgi:hypothetical protein
MSNNITASQNANLDYLDQLGEGLEGLEKAQGNALVKAGQIFLDILSNKIDKYKPALISSGNLQTKGRLQIVDDKRVDIYLPYYYDYVNKGVKGVQSQKNAPNSPYSFKHYGMSADGRKNIKDLIRRGKAMVQIKQAPVGREKRGKSLEDQKVDTLIYNIKKYGIKRRPYFDEALAESRKEIASIVGKAYGKEITISIKPK